MTITEIAIKRPTLIVVLFAVLGTLGIMGYSQLKYDLLPKISPPIITVATIYPGASPSEIENNISKIVEDAVSGLDKVAAIRSTSLEGRSLVTIEFTQSANVNLALQDVQRKVNESQRLLPKDARAPIISKFALDEIPVLRMGITGKMPSREMYQFVLDYIQPRISKVDGVGQITLVGGEERQIRINLDAQKIRSYGLSLMQVTNTIKASNLDFPTGNIKEDHGQYVVRVAGKFSSIDELRNIVIAHSKAGGNIKLNDIGEIEDGRKEYTSISRINGETAIGILVSKQNDANSVDVSKLVRKELTKIEKDYESKGIKFTLSQDGSLFTIDAADAVKHDLMLAILMVALVMFLFLHSIRSSLIILVAIPASLISTFVGMWIFGFSLNLMTLLAMSLVIGILVDDSIVVLENIYRHIELGEDKRSAAIKGRNEIGFAALSITLVDVVVFVPISLLSGIVGNILREFAVVVVVSTLLSLLVSFTITPALASRFAKHERLTNRTLLGKFALAFERFFHWIQDEYRIVLNWSLNHRWVIISSSVSLFIGAIMLVKFGFIGFEFIPQADRGEFTVTIELPSGSTFNQTNLTTLDVEKVVAKIPEVKNTFVSVGASSEGLLGQYANNTAEISVALFPKEQRNRSTDDIGLEIKKQVQQIPGVKVRINPIGIFGVANQTPIQMVINGADFEQTRAAAQKLMDITQSIPGTADVRLSTEVGKPETRVEIDREKMASLGLTINDVGSSLKIALSGDDDTKFREGTTEYSILITLDERDRSKTDQIGSMTFVNPRGQQIELQQFAKIYQTTGPTKLQRENRNSAITVFSQVIGVPAGTIVSNIKLQWEGTKEKPGIQPIGISTSYLGDQKNQDDSSSSMLLALLAAILFVYLVMVALYDSYVYPFVVLFSVPTALIGALLAMALAMKALGIFSMLGIVMLVGLVSKNAILLVDRANQMRAEKGLGVFEALIEAGETRLRPIVMTTVAMIVGMLPLAISSGAGAEWKTGLATAIIGGLTSSLLLTLVLVPVIYVKIEQWRIEIPAFFRKITHSFRSEKSVEENLV